MSNNDEIFRFDRRNFLKSSGYAGLTMTGAFQAITHLRLIDRAVAAGSGMTTGQLGAYKALVCIFLRGGSDMNNLIVPTGGNTQKAGYVADRGIARVPEDASEQGDPNQATIDGTTGPGATYITPANDNGFGTDYGLHPSCQNMKLMFEAGQMGFVTNVGTLVEPIPLNPTQTQYNNSMKPIQLFSHSDQVNEHMSGNADSPFVSGWGGRVSNLLHDFWNVNPGISQTSMMITLAGNNDFMVAGGNSQLSQLALTTSGPISLINLDPASTNADTARRGTAYKAILDYPYSHVFEKGYTGTVNNAIANEAVLGEALTFTETGHVNYLNVDMIGIFLAEFGVAAEGNLPSTARELLMTARLIAGRRCLGNQRQIFFCDQGGYDTHQDINADQPALLTELDSSIGAFNECMRQLDPAINGSSLDTEFVYDQVTGFQMSDFNRTWTPNGSDFNFSGTDHAWGTHKFVFGGAVETQQGGAGGGKLYGFYPQLAVGGANDVPGNNNRGRWIPSTSTDFFSARLANWFGVDQTTLNTTLFPNISNFPTTPFDPAANLDFLPVV